MRENALLLFAGGADGLAPQFGHDEGMRVDGVCEQMTRDGLGGLVGLLAPLAGERPRAGLPQAGRHRGWVVVGRGLRHGLGRGVQRVGEVGRVGQGALGLGSPPVRHEPAGDGHGHGHQREQRGDHQRDDEPQLGQAHAVDLLDLGTRFGRGRHLALFPLEGEDGVGLHHDLLAELPLLEGAAPHLQVCGLPPPPPAKGIHAVTVHGRAGSEADADVALEAQVVAAGELEGVEAGHEHLVLGIVLPVVKDGAVRGAAIGVCHLVLRLLLVVHGLGNAATGKPAIDLMRLYSDLEQQVVPDLGATDFLAVHGADLHLARGRGARVGNGARRGDHADVEAQGDGLLARVVDALDVVGAGAVGDQLGVLLDDEHEGGLAVDVHQAARVEEHLEVDRLALAARHQPAALGVLAVPLHVDHPVEAVQLHQHLHPVRQAHHIEATRWNVRTRWFRPWWWGHSVVAAMDLVIWVTNKVGRTDANGNVVRHSAQGAWSANVARGCALMRVDITLLVQRAVIVCLASFLNPFTSANEWIAHGAGRTDAIVASWKVDAFRPRRARVMDGDTLVDIYAHSVGLKLVASWADTEALLGPDVDAVLILGARVRRRAVTARQDAVFSHTVVVGWAATCAA